MTLSDSAAVRPGEDLDWEALDDFLRARIEGSDGEFAVQQFIHGSANLTYRVSFGDRHLVVRRPPFGDIAPGAHDMGREYRALSRLWRSYPRAPRAYLHCADHSIVGAEFIVLEYRPGVVIWNELPEPMRSLPEAGRRVGLAVIDALADLHLLDPATHGLTDLGRPAGFLARQLSGWRKRWELVRDDGKQDAVDRLGERLAAMMPVAERAAVLHNDFKLDNCQFAADDPDRVISVFDWDMATLGDPLIDLGTLLCYWPDSADGEMATSLVPGLDRLGLPGRAEVVQRYAARTGTDPGDVVWYEAFGCWKTAIVLRQLQARYLRGETADGRMADLGRHVLPLARRGVALMGQTSANRAG